MHLDLEVDDREHAAVGAVGLGGRRVGEIVVEEEGAFQVMHDPEGNELCFVHD